MQLNDKGEVIWEPVNPAVVDIYRGALAYHLHSQFQKTFQPEKPDDQTSGA